MRSEGDRKAIVTGQIQLDQASLLLLYYYNQRIQKSKNKGAIPINNNHEWKSCGIFWSRYSVAPPISNDNSPSSELHPHY